MGLHLFIFTLFAMLLFPKRKVSNIYCKTCLKWPLKKKTVLSGHSKRRPKIKLVFTTDYHLMLVKSIAECSKGSILQYFRPSFSYHLSLRPLLCLFLSGRLRQVLLLSVSVKHQITIAVNS